VLARWRPVRPAAALPRESLGVAMAAGIRYVSMSPAIRNVLARSAIFGAGASGLMALMPLIARDLLGGGPLVYGMMLGAFGAGAVAGAIGSAKLRSMFSTETIVRGACVAFAIAAAVAGVSTSLPATLAGLLLAGAGWVLTLATFNVTVQLSAPRWVVARALSLYQMAAFGGIAGGSWLWGVVAERESILAALLACAAVLLGCAAFGARRPLAQSEALDLDPLRQWNAPETAVPVNLRTGPVVITVEYLIRPDDQLEFLAAMAERRRIRRRDGALNWRLLRDLADPELWVERYETPTWLDYVRLNNRMTRHDAGIPESLRALHRGPGLPRVRRMIERPAVAQSARVTSGPQDVTVAPD
jgi:MFS family permease